MVAHYSQKISVGIALVCMVNHSAIAQHKNSMDMPMTQLDIDCPRASGAANIVRNQKTNNFNKYVRFHIRKDHIHGQKIFKVLY